MISKVKQGNSGLRIRIFCALYLLYVISVPHGK